MPAATVEQLIVIIVFKNSPAPVRWGPFSVDVANAVATQVAARNDVEKITMEAHI